MSKEPSEPLVPGRPSGLTIAVYRPEERRHSATSSLVATVKVDNAEAIGRLLDLLNRLTPHGLPPPPSVARLPSAGAHDVLHFGYLDGGERIIMVKRDGWRTVSTDGRPGSWSPTMPLYATIDVLLPPDLREDLGNPVAYPPSERPQYISEEEAIAIALGCTSGALPTEQPPAYARLMTREETGAFDPALGANNASPHPDRKVWLVSVHDEVQTRGTLVTAPATVHGYSLIIDAETGTVTDRGIGSAPLGRDICQQCRR